MHYDTSSIPYVEYISLAGVSKIYNLGETALSEVTGGNHLW